METAGRLLFVGALVGGLSITVTVVMVAAGVVAFKEWVLPD